MSISSESLAPDVADIQAVCAKHYGISVAQLLGPSRIGHISAARHVAMYFARERTGASYPRIGAAFRRDHATVIHACNRVPREFQGALLSALRSKLGNRPVNAYHTQLDALAELVIASRRTEPNGLLA